MALQRKRESSLHLFQLEITCGRSIKRCRVCKDGSDCPDCVLPLQPEQDLGPFWVTTGRFHSLEVPALEAAACSLGSWGLQQVSLSFAVQTSMSGGCADIDDEDTQDTATSSSEGGTRTQQYALARKPRAAATGEEDSITSSQPVPSSSAAFSFGNRPYLTPDLTEVHCWDIMNHLLAAV